MAKDLVAEVPKAKEMFDRASEILGYDLLKVSAGPHAHVPPAPPACAHRLLQLCVEGPKDKLDSTVISQPAIYVASLAAVEKLRATEGQAAVDAIDVACGLSLGEYTALAFAGAIRYPGAEPVHHCASLAASSPSLLAAALRMGCGW
jgi:[acyl-carrier-protein] S-malonyltransferase